MWPPDTVTPSILNLNFIIITDVYETNLTISMFNELVWQTMGADRNCVSMCGCLLRTSILRISFINWIEMGFLTSQMPLLNSKNDIKTFEKFSDKQQKMYRQRQKHWFTVQIRYEFLDNEIDQWNSNIRNEHSHLFINIDGSPPLPYYRWVRAPFVIQFDYSL